GREAQIGERAIDLFKTVLDAIARLRGNQRGEFLLSRLQRVGRPRQQCLPCLGRKAVVVSLDPGNRLLDIGPAVETNRSYRPSRIGIDDVEMVAAIDPLFSHIHLVPPDSDWS